MYTMSLNELYNFLVEEKKMDSFMSYNEQINLIPASNVEYRDKIRGTMMSLAIGDIFANDSNKLLSMEVDSLDSFSKGDKHIKAFDITSNTQAAIGLAESLLIFQCFHQPIILYHLN